MIHCLDPNEIRCPVPGVDLLLCSHSRPALRPGGVSQRIESTKVIDGSPMVVLLLQNDVMATVTVVGFGVGCVRQGGGFR